MDQSTFLEPGISMKTKQKHIYDYEIDITSDTAQANVIRLVGSNKRVLEIGCGPGSITKLLCKHFNCMVTGIELDSEAIKLAAPYCERIMQADLNSSEWPNLMDDVEKFDVVIAADVLEHLYDPWMTLQRMTSLINSDGFLVISLPHVGHAAIISCLVNGDFAYGEWGLLDRTHIRFFGLKNIEALFVQAHLKIIEAKYVIRHPEETEFASSWLKLEPTLRDVLLSGMYSQVYQVVVKVVPVSYAGMAVPLVPPERHPISAKVALWKSRLGRHLSPRMQECIHECYSLLKIKL